MGCGSSRRLEAAPCNAPDVRESYTTCAKHGNIPFTKYNEKDNEIYCSSCFGDYRRRNIGNDMKHCVSIDQYIESLTFKQKVVRIEEELRNTKREFEKHQTNLKCSIQTIGTQKNELVDDINSFVNTIVNLLQHLAEDLRKKVLEVIKQELDVLSNMQILVATELQTLDEIKELVDTGKNQRRDSGARLCSVIDSVNMIRKLRPGTRDLSQIAVELTLYKSLRLGDIKETTSGRSNLKLGEVNVIKHETRSSSVDYSRRQRNTVTLADILVAVTNKSDLEKSHKNVLEPDNRNVSKNNTITTANAEYNKDQAQEARGRKSPIGINAERGPDQTMLADIENRPSMPSRIRRLSSDSKMRTENMYPASLSENFIDQVAGKNAGRTSMHSHAAANDVEINDNKNNTMSDQPLRLQSEIPPLQRDTGNVPSTNRATTPATAASTIRTSMSSITPHHQGSWNVASTSKTTKPEIIAGEEQRKKSQRFIATSAARQSCRRSEQSISTSLSIIKPSDIHAGTNKMIDRKIKKIDEFQIPVVKHNANIIDSVFLHDGWLVLCDSKNECLNLFNQAFEFHDRLSLDSQPHSITVTSANEIAVSLPNAKTICYIKIVSGRFSDEGLHKRFRTGAPCRGVVCIQGSVLYTTRKYVIVHKDDGGDLKFKYQFREPVSLTADEEEKRLFVSCFGPNSFGEVVVMKTNGEIEFTVSGRKARHPVCCTLDREKNIYICDVNPPRINQVSPEGNASRVLMESQSEKYQHINFLPREDIFLLTSNDSNTVTLYEMV